MTELKAFLAMLERAGIGHGMRDDYNPPGTGVQVEHDGDDTFPVIIDWWFDADGKLVEVNIVQD